MNKKMYIGIVIVVAIVAVVVIAIFMLNRRKEEQFMNYIPSESVWEEKRPEVHTGSGEMKDEVMQKNQILCKAKSREEAQKIAEKIGGKLVGYMEGVGIIAIEESASELMKRLEKEGIGDIELYPNLNYSAMEKKIGF